MEQNNYRRDQEDCQDEQTSLTYISIAFGATTIVALIVLSFVIYKKFTKRGPNDVDVELGEHPPDQCPNASASNSSVVIWPETPGQPNERPPVLSAPRLSSQFNTEGFDEVDLTSLQNAQAVPIVPIQRSESQVNVSQPTPVQTPRTYTIRTINLTARSREASQPLKEVAITPTVAKESGASGSRSG
ncbi:hypothetical protein GGS21DRAFT_544635 [Xylaria nigripes]|nr:hypothetical protein GGS21DRAFT_544635 [Xylaria nigripes]